MNARSLTAGVRRGFTWIDLLVSLLVVGIAAVLFIPTIPRITDKHLANTCRSNLKNIASSLVGYAIRNGRYPGYLNALERTDGQAYVDPETNEVTPVSWVTMILSDLDRAALFEHWRHPPVINADAETRNKFNSYKHVYLEFLICPSDRQPTRDRPTLSYIANTGMPDLAAATIDEHGPDGGVPRDWAANGIFFDQYSEHPLFKPEPARRGPMVVMRDDMITDPKDKTILLTENVDATKYVFNAKTQAADGWRAAEIQTGCVWRPSIVDVSKKPPQMNPPPDMLPVNAATGKGDGKSFAHCRPSSHHAGGVNVAFVGQNVQFLSDKIPYFVYAKLMASDDEQARTPGFTGEAADDPNIAVSWRNYELREEEFHP